LFYPPLLLIIKLHSTPVNKNTYFYKQNKKYFSKYKKLIYFTSKYAMVDRLQIRYNKSRKMKKEKII
jgi:hypothetical protein